MIAQSQSGTGKTAAFVLTMLSRCDPTFSHPQVGTVSNTIHQAGIISESECRPFYK